MAVRVPVATQRHVLFSKVCFIEKEHYPQLQDRQLNEATYGGAGFI